MPFLDLFEVNELLLSGKREGAKQVLSSLRVKVAQMQTDVGLGDQRTVLLDDVLALIDEEMRDA